MESVQAQITKLREELRKEHLEILKVAAERRKRARPGEAQKIILWEMNSLHHAETKYMSKIDKVMKDAVGSFRPPGSMKASPKRFSDKRPSQKEKRTSE
jgi:hypothetical protein